MSEPNATRPDTRSLDWRTIHVLSNHLGVILGFIELVLEDTPADDPQRGDLLEIKNAAAAAVALLQPAPQSD